MQRLLVEAAVREPEDLEPETERLMETYLGQVPRHLSSLAAEAHMLNIPRRDELAQNARSLIMLVVFIQSAKNTEHKPLVHKCTFV
jgi:hypothetical protein